MSEELKSGTKREPNGYLWNRGSTCFQTPEVDREKNITFLSRNLSKLAPPLLAPILNMQTSHFVKVLFVISLSQSRNGVSGFCAQGAFSELFCRGVVKQRKWTEKLGILCRCICQGCRTSIVVVEKMELDHSLYGGTHIHIWSYVWFVRVRIR